MHVIRAVGNTSLHCASSDAKNTANTKIAIRRVTHWPFACTFVSLLIGMFTNFLDLGHSVHLPEPSAGASISTTAFNLSNFVSHVVPISIFQAMASNEILPILVFAVFFGIAAGAMKEVLPTALITCIDGASSDAVPRIPKIGKISFDAIAWKMLIGTTCGGNEIREIESSRADSMHRPEVSAGASISEFCPTSCQ